MHDGRSHEELAAPERMSRSKGATETRLAQLGLELPAPPRPVGRYVLAKRVHDLLFVSGHGPGMRQDGRPAFVGRVGAEVPLTAAREAARLCALNCLASIKSVVGSLDKVCGVVQLRVFVNSADEFHEQPKVADGASELLISLFGELGGHARAALGTSNLPGNIPVEVEMVVQVVNDPTDGVKEGT